MPEPLGWQGAVSLRELRGRGAQAFTLLSRAARRRGTGALSEPTESPCSEKRQLKLSGVSQAARLQAGGASSPSSPEAGVQAAHMMAGLSLQQQQQAEGVPGGMVRPGLGMPGYLPMQMPFSFVPGAGGVPQAVPNVQVPPAFSRGTLVSSMETMRTAVLGGEMDGCAGHGDVRQPAATFQWL